MVEDLLFIARDLLHSLSLTEFTEDEKDYVINVAERVIDISLIELKKVEKDLNGPISFCRQKFVKNNFRLHSLL